VPERGGCRSSRAGKKSAEKIIKSIEYLEKFGERARLDQALKLPSRSLSLSKTWMA
jgi:hypothetical protein